MRSRLRSLMISMLARGGKSVIGRRLGKIRLVRRVYFFLLCILIRMKAKRVAPDTIRIEGHVIYLDPSDTGVARYLLEDGVYETYETLLFKNAVKEGMVVVDVGANIGWYTLVAAARVGDRGRVYAFEPDPSNYALLMKNIQANGYGNVIAVQKAISRETGTARLFLCVDNKGDHRIYDSHDGREAITVSVTSLDEFFRDNECPIDIIKMDMQGAEIAGLQGMSKVIKSNTDLMIFTEFWAVGLRNFGSSPAEFVEILRGHGFEVYVIEGTRLKPFDLARVMRMCAGGESVDLFCKRSKGPVVDSNE